MLLFWCLVGVQIDRKINIGNSGIMVHSNKINKNNGTITYSSDELKNIGQIVQHTRELKIISPSTCNRLRQLRIFKRRKRGEKDGKRIRTSQGPIQMNGVNKNNLIQIGINCELDEKQDNTRIKAILLNTQSMKNKEFAVMNYLNSVKCDICFITETWLTHIHN